jgi:AraC-like DNA-binding protein
MDATTSLHRTVEGLRIAEALFDRVPDVVFFVKDLEARYVVVNQTLVNRCGVPSKTDLLGRTAREVFPSPLGDRYLEQDLAVCSGGAPIQGQLELHLYPTRLEGWCLTEKLPLHSSDGGVFGMAGISRDLQAPGRGVEGLSELAAAVEHLRANFDQAVRVEELAGLAGLSAYQLNRRLRSLLGITAGQLIVKTRVDAASQMLRGGDASIADVALACGYCDQSAFSRQFRRTTGVTPQQYRERHGRG